MCEFMSGYNYASVLNFFESRVDQDRIVEIPEEKIYGEYRRFAKYEGEPESLLNFMTIIQDDRYIFDMYCMVTGLMNE